jgi:hypothetical protein
MEKSRSLAILMLLLTCLFLIACQTAGTPTESDSPPAKSRPTAGPQAPPAADSASKNRTASYSRSVGIGTSAQLKQSTVKAVDRSGNFSRAVKGKSITTLRIILYATLAVIFVVVVGAITADNVGRRRKLTPSPLIARHSRAVPS